MVFAEDLMKLLKLLPKTEANIIFYKQVLRSGTSVGANYMEANGTYTKKDKRHKLVISRKEAKETRYWLRLIKTENPGFTKQCKELIDEVLELVLILSSIIIKT